MTPSWRRWRWRSAGHRDGHGQIVALVGEPGVGKSRLVWEATRSARTDGWLVLESGAVSYGKATSYGPVIDLLKAYCRIEARDDGPAVREKLTGRLLALDRALAPDLPALLALLDVAVEDAAWEALDPPRRRDRTLAALKRLLLRESQEAPLLLVFEDLHWIDAETQALLDALVESLPAARMLLLVNYRPEYDHHWGRKTYYTQLRVDPLPTPARRRAARRAPRRGRRLARAEAASDREDRGQPALPGGERPQPGRGRRAGRRAGRLSPGAAVDTIRVPDTVQTVLGARIDRLEPEAKRLLQTAAVIGKDVPFALLRAIAEVPDDELARRARPPAGRRVHVRSAALPGAGLHLQARPDPRGGVRQPAPGAPSSAPRPHRRGDRTQPR